MLKKKSDDSNWIQVSNNSFAFIKLKNSLNEILYTTHPVISQLLSCCKEFALSIKLIDVADFLSLEHPAIELLVFLSMCSRNFDNTIDVSIKK